MESKGQLKARLTAEGRWPEFLARREQLKAEGLPGPEARAVARLEFSGLTAEEHAKMLEPKPKKELAAGLAEREASGAVEREAKEMVAPAWVKADVGNLTKAQIGEAILWAFTYIEVADVEASDAPTPAAWGLWKWARSSPQARTDFYRNLVVKLLPNKAQLDAEDLIHDDGSELLNRLERLIQIGEGALLPSGSERVAGES